jgi:hypothetical protein
MFGFPVYDEFVSLPPTDWWRSRATSRLAAAAIVAAGYDDNLDIGGDKGPCHSLIEAPGSQRLCLDELSLRHEGLAEMVDPDQSRLVGFRPVQLAAANARRCHSRVFSRPSSSENPGV